MTHRTLRVRTSGASYPVHVLHGPGLLSGALLSATRRHAGVWLLADRNTARLHARRLVRALEAQGRHVHLTVVPPGEASKDFPMLERCCREGIRAGVTREWVLASVGGGMVGDLGGLVAGLFLRGIDWINVPTSLLAQVDASVGGKVAVDVGPFKNAAGLFRPPKAVLADVGILRTLPVREFRSGLAESLKMAAVLSAREFEWLESRVGRLGPGSSGALLGDLVGRSVRLKASVVESDEFDRGRRALLNFGHTLGHALEGALGYRRLLHGEAVAIGCAFAAGLSVEQGLLPALEADRLVAAFRRAGLPVVAPRGMSASRVLSLMRSDKKQSSRGLACVLTGPLGVGSVRFQPNLRAVGRSLATFLRGSKA